MAEYVEDGNSVSGKIAFPECPPQPQGRNIVFKFPRMRGNKCVCDLIVRDGNQYLGEAISRKNLPHLTPDAAEDAQRSPAPSPGISPSPGVGSTPMLSEPPEPVENQAALEAQFLAATAETSDFAAEMERVKAQSTQTPEEHKALAEQTQQLINAAPTPDPTGPSGGQVMTSIPVPSHGADQTVPSREEISRLIPSVDQIQAELDRMYLPTKPTSETPAVEIMDDE